MTIAALIVIGAAAVWGISQVARDFVEAWPRLVRLMRGDFEE